MTLCAYPADFQRGDSKIFKPDVKILRQEGPPVSGMSQSDKGSAVCGEQVTPLWKKVLQKNKALTLSVKTFCVKMVIMQHLL